LAAAVRCLLCLLAVPAATFDCCCMQSAVRLRSAFETAEPGFKGVVYWINPLRLTGALDLVGFFRRLCRRALVGGGECRAPRAAVMAACLRWVAEGAGVAVGATLPPVLSISAAQGLPASLRAPWWRCPLPAVARCRRSTLGKTHALNGVPMRRQHPTSLARH
jgi:hypothetical protein